MANMSGSASSRLCSFPVDLARRVTSNQNRTQHGLLAPRNDGVTATKRGESEAEFIAYWKPSICYMKCIRHPNFWEAEHDSRGPKLLKIPRGKEHAIVPILSHFK